MAPEMLKWGDRYPFSGQVKGSTLLVEPGRFTLIVTSHYSIEQCVSGEAEKGAQNKLLIHFPQPRRLAQLRFPIPMRRPLVVIQMHPDPCRRRAVTAIRRESGQTETYMYRRLRGTRLFVWVLGIMAMPTRVATITIVGFGVIASAVDRRPPIRNVLNLDSSPSIFSSVAVQISARFGPFLHLLRSRFARVTSILEFVAFQIWTCLLLFLNLLRSRFGLVYFYSCICCVPNLDLFTSIPAFVAFQI
jgi:hypothetical protein